MLGSAKLMAVVTVSDAARAKPFYQDVLGLKLVNEDAFALVFDAGGTTLRIALAQKVTVPPYTVAGWEVADANATVRALSARGIRFERFPGMDQDELGMWVSPSGAKVAWFKDPDGNLLSVSQMSVNQSG
jgi:catechol 2,3-dioxygenase-like lactoylglutathione lyase family enzyme